MNNELDLLISKSSEAQLIFEKISNKEINRLIGNISSKILNKKTNRYLSQLAVNETKFGNVIDKMYKNFYKTKNLLNDLKNVKTNIPIYDKKNKLVTILKPIGVICGLTPSTNPIATALNYIINSV